MSHFEANKTRLASVPSAEGTLTQPEELFTSLFSHFGAPAIHAPEGHKLTGCWSGLGKGVQADDIICQYYWTCEQLSRVMNTRVEMEAGLRKCPDGAYEIMSDPYFRDSQNNTVDMRLSKAWIKAIAPVMGKEAVEVGDTIRLYSLAQA